MIQIDTCKPDPLIGKVCEQESEIADFLNKNIFYAISQKTIVNKQIKPETSDSVFGSPDNYFPLQKGTNSMFYSILE